MPETPRILIICHHNSGRSQIAEAYLQKLGGKHLVVESAGLEPAEAVHPLVIKVMKEEGVDLSRKRPQGVFDLFKKGKIYDHVITVCSETELKCPIFPGITKRWHTPFPDPSQVEGSYDEQVAQVREIRDKIKKWIQNPEPDDFVSNAGFFDQESD